jgi:mono/diheme cytochrome c family protein
MLRLALILLIVGPVAAADLPPPADRRIDFERDVRPLFVQHCYSCHGPDKQRAGLRLDRKADALKGSDDGPVILPGKSAESTLVRLTAGLDPDRVMPPKGERLTREQVGVLRAWIDQGADWPGAAETDDPRNWWSLRSLNRPALARLSADDEARARNPVDRFILAKLREKGLAPSPEADRRTLIRRVYTDLIGLPPTPDEVESFLKDSSADAYERLVDRLLASPHYGERWARHWLDVVHYGDTHGYDKDQPRPNAWPYRDYVIRSLNADKPYSRFVQEQIAGDVLYPGTLDGATALGFIAAGPWDLIGHAEVPETKIDGKIARHLDRDDMVANTINTFASLTVQCAQCHNHKFDPISQEEYYRLQAVFAALDRTDRPYHTDPAAAKRHAELTAKRAALRNRQDELNAKVKKLGGPELADLDKRIAAGKSGHRKPEYGYHSHIEPKPDRTKWVQVDLGQSIAIDKVVLWGCHDDFNNIGPGFGFPVRFKVELSDDAQFDAGVSIVADHTAADVPNPGLAPLLFPTKGTKGRYLRVTATKLAPRQNDFIFALAELEAFDANGKNAAAGAPITALDSIEAPVRWRKSNLTDGYAPGQSSADDIARLKNDREALLSRVVDAETKAALKSVAADLAGVEAELKKVPPAGLVYAGAIHHGGSATFRGTGPDNGRPRPIFLLKRGDVKSPTREVAPGTLAIIPGLTGDFTLPPGHPEGARRAALARWLTDSKNPLPWRSIVNRVWQYHFGRGLVATPNDFGKMGQLPSHPELLDWLAADFRDGPQSLKALHRLLVTSATYRQASAGNERFDKLDSSNVYLWRMARRKLEAEAVRDSALAVCGNLDRTMHGPAFQDFVIQHPEHSPHYQYHLADPDDPKLRRRSVYRFLVRSKPQPFMTVLDCADPSMQVEKRTETLSPLQALALFNNAFMLTHAKHLAARSGDVRTAFRLALGREPTMPERDALESYARDHGLPNACRVILNLNEFVFID